MGIPKKKKNMLYHIKDAIKHEECCEIFDFRFEGHSVEFFWGEGGDDGYTIELILHGAGIKTEIYLETTLSIKQKDLLEAIFQMSREIIDQFVLNHKNGDEYYVGLEKFGKETYSH